MRVCDVCKKGKSEFTCDWFDLDGNGNKDFLNDVCWICKAKIIDFVMMLKRSTGEVTVISNDSKEVMELGSSLMKWRIK